MKSLKGLIKRIEAIGEWRKGRTVLPEPILNGNEIMKLLKLKPSPAVGKLILKLREAQLRGTIKTKEQAKKFLTKK